MPLGYWDQRLALRYAPDNGDGGDGGNNNGGDGAGGGGGGSNNNGGGSKTPPPWAGEFGDNFDPEKAWNTITSQRESEKALKKTVGDLTKRVETFENANKTDLEKLTSERDDFKKKAEELEGRERAASIRTQVAEAARLAGALYPEDAHRLIDSDDLQVGDDGKVKNAATLLADLKKARPQLFNRNGANAADGKQNGGGSGGDMNSIIRRAAGRS